MKESSDRPVEDYIERITAFSHNFQRIPTSGELDKIVSELGITDEQISLIQTESQAHFIRAKSYIKLKQWDDAIEELQEGISLNPFSLEMISCLGEAYMGRWQLKHKREDAVNIQSTAKRCLQIKPDCQITMNLLHRFNCSKKWRKNSRIIFSILTISLVTSSTSAIFIYYKPLKSMVLSSSFATSLLNQNIESEIIVKHLQKNIEDIKSEQSALKKEINFLKNEQLELKSTLNVVQEKYSKISNANQDSHKLK